MTISVMPSSFTAGTNLASMLGSANPYIAGVQALGSLFGGGTKFKQSGANTSGSVVSGIGESNAENGINFGGSVIDLENPLHIGAIAAGLVLAIWIYHKKIK